jgi:hypothetical protein
MESAESRLTSGHAIAHPAGDRNGQAAPSGLHAFHKEDAKAADPETARADRAGQAGKTGGAARREEDAKETGRAHGAHRIVIASYTKFKGISVEKAGAFGDADPGRKPVPVPAMQLIGANLDVRV